MISMLQPGEEALICLETGSHWLWFRTLCCASLPAGTSWLPSMERNFASNQGHEFRVTAVQGFCEEPGPSATLLLVNEAA